MYYGGKILFRAEQSKSWPATQGVIKESSVERGHKSSYRAKVIYDYTVDGNNFTGGRVFYGSFSTNKTDAQKVADKYPKDKTLVFYCA